MYTDDEIRISMFRDGELVFADPGQAKETITDAEILQADKDGLLVGALGNATIRGHCPKCGWKGHEHFEIGDGEREMAYYNLLDKHTTQSGDCLVGLLGLEFQEVER